MYSKFDSRNYTFRDTFLSHTKSHCCTILDLGSTANDILFSHTQRSSYTSPNAEHAAPQWILDLLGLCKKHLKTEIGFSVRYLRVFGNKFKRPFSCTDKLCTKRDGEQAVQVSTIVPLWGRNQVIHNKDLNREKFFQRSLLKYYLCTIKKYIAFFSQNTSGFSFYLVDFSRRVSSRGTRNIKLPLRVTDNFFFPSKNDSRRAFGLPKSSRRVIGFPKPLREFYVSNSSGLKRFNTFFSITVLRLFLVFALFFNLLGIR